LPDDAENIAFFIGVALLWFWVGAFCDRSLGSEIDKRPLQMKSALFQFLLIPPGLLLLLLAVVGFSGPGVNERLIQYSFMLVWSVVLIGLPVIDFRSTRKARPGNSR
jgi:hypothetical protein